jgi:hypothetical protein
MRAAACVRSDLKTFDNPTVKVVSKDVFDKFNVKADELAEPEKPKS